VTHEETLELLAVGFAEMTRRTGIQQPWIDDLETWLELGCPSEPAKHDYRPDGDLFVCGKCGSWYPADDSGLARNVCLEKPTKHGRSVHVDDPRPPSDDEAT